jgi:hypothetical protein
MQNLESVGRYVRIEMEIDFRMEQLGYLAEGSHSHGWGTMQLAIAHAELQKLGGAGKCLRPLLPANV